MFQVEELKELQTPDVEAGSLVADDRLPAGHDAAVDTGETTEDRGGQRSERNALGLRAGARRRDEGEPPEEEDSFGEEEDDELEDEEEDFCEDDLDDEDDFEEFVEEDEEEEADEEEEGDE
jgi:hypothetical protein